MPRSPILGGIENTVSIYPVIMCGGAGTRLWPSSRPNRPKQFIALHGQYSLFQNTALRAARLLDAGGNLVVVCGLHHEPFIVEQLAEIGLKAQVILEPEGRDSAPAMTAAALWTSRVDPVGVNAFISSDHYLPDNDAFYVATLQAAEAARVGRIVTLGVQPTSPSSAYGYIKPAGEGLSEVESFVEKPDEATAQQFIDQGLLWNTGIFIARSDVFLEEVSKFAPTVIDAVKKALGKEPVVDALDSPLYLAPSFAAAPKLSIDYAVMEKTRRASVLHVDFEWSDLGAWDAVAATMANDQDRHLLIDSEGTIARSPEDVVVTVLGARNLAVVVERDAVLVCDLNRSQDVKAVVERLKTVSPKHLDFEKRQTLDFTFNGQQLLSWLKLRALPVWSALAIRDDGIFAEAMSLDGNQVEANHRQRVQARQLFSFIKSGQLGWAGPWQEIVTRGGKAFERYYIGEGNQVHGLLSPALGILSTPASVYDQAFSMFALASLNSINGDSRYQKLAENIRDQLIQKILPIGGLAETDGHAYQSNAHMHLLEACLAWGQQGDSKWMDLADQIVELACTKFIDKQKGCLREYFEADWSPAQGDIGRQVEPGHQFEWAWLLTCYARQRNVPQLIEAAKKLYCVGMRGYSQQNGVMVNAIDPDGLVLDGSARLWPQTEWIRAALILSEHADDVAKRAYLREAAMGVSALQKYLTDDGLWRDLLLEDGTFREEASPASSLYHIVGACAQLVQTLRRMGHEASLGRSIEPSYM